MSAHSVGYSGSLSAVNETNCNKKVTLKNSYELISNSSQTCPTSMCLKMNAIVFVDLDGNALQFVLLIRSVNDFSSRERLHNQIEVSKAHVCLLFFRVRYLCPLYPLFSSGMSLYVWPFLQVHPTLCTLVLSIRLRVVVHDKLDL